MHLSEKMSMENNAANQESNGEMFVHRVASSGKVLKFKVDKYGTPPSKHTISSQEVMMSAGKQNARELVDNFEANCSPNAIPSLEQSEISAAEATRINKISLFDNAKVASPDEIANTAAAVDKPIMVHTCNECGKSFKEMISLHGHKGVHRREEKKHMRMMMAEQQPTVSSQKPRKTKKDEMKTTLIAAQTLEMLLMEFKWHQKDNLSASMTCSNKHISADEETDEMREIAEFLETRAQSFCEDSTMHVSSSSASIAKCFVCTTCKKTFSSSNALGGHMSIHSNKRTKYSLLEDGGAGSTWEHVCDKCNEKFPTGQILGGHKRKHWWEEHYKAKALLEAQNVKPPLTILPHHELERTGLVVVPTDENIQPAGTTGLVVAAHTVPLACDDVQKPQQAMTQGNEIELPVPSGVSDEDLA